MVRLARKIKNRVDNHHIAERGPWGSCADLVGLDQPFAGDCKAYSMTCAELLIQEGALPEDVRLAHCRTEKDEPHLVCVYGLWVLDNLLAQVSAWEKLPYLWIESMRMDEPGVWREAVT